MSFKNDRHFACLASENGFSSSPPSPKSLLHENEPVEPDGDHCRLGVDGILGLEVDVFVPEVTKTE